MLVSSVSCPQGVLGEVSPLPEGLPSTDALWTVPPGEDIEHVQLVRWRLALPDGVGQWVLLCRMAGEAPACTRAVHCAACRRLAALPVCACCCLACPE